MSAIYQSRAQADMAAERLKIYAQPQRLMILSRLLDGEHLVGDIECATGIGQPALSQQLAELRRGKLVTMRREAKQVYYRLADQDVELCVRTMEALFGTGKDLPVPEPSWATVAATPRVPRPVPSPRPTSAAAFARIG